MAYATLEDVIKRMNRDLSLKEQEIAETLLDDAAVLIDAFNQNANNESKKIVSCRMIIRALGEGDTGGIPVGATQGSVAGLGYSQSWTLSNGSVGQLYLDKTDKKYLGCGDKIGSYSPVEQLASKELIP